MLIQESIGTAVDAIKAAGKRCVVATPRILKPDEERLWKFYLRLGADALLVDREAHVQRDGPRHLEGSCREHTTPGGLA